MAEPWSSNGDASAMRSAGLAAVDGEAPFLLYHSRSFNPRQPREGYRPPVTRRAIDSLDHPHVLEALHARRLRLSIADDAVRKVLHEAGDRVDRFEPEFLTLALLDELEHHRPSRLERRGEPQQAVLTEDRERRGGLLAKA